MHKRSLLFLVTLHCNTPAAVDATPFTEANTINGNQIGIWTPALAIPEATDVQITDHYLRLFPYHPNGYSLGSEILFLQHYIVTIVQPDFDYYDYPDDRQVRALLLPSFIDHRTILPPTLIWLPLCGRS
jgi:hypothetical protein